MKIFLNMIFFEPSNLVILYLFELFVSNNYFTIFLRLFTVHLKMHFLYLHDIEKGFSEILLT